MVIIGRNRTRGQRSARTVPGSSVRGSLSLNARVLSFRRLDLLGTLALFLIAFGEAPVTLFAPLFLGRLDGRAVAIDLCLRAARRNGSRPIHYLLSFFATSP